MLFWPKTFFLAHLQFDTDPVNTDMQLLYTELCLLLFTMLLSYHHKLIPFVDLCLLANSFCDLFFSVNSDFQSFSCSENKLKGDTLNHNYDKMPTYAPRRQLMYLSSNMYIL